MAKHWRRGHRRNGKWVKGGWVRGSNPTPGCALLLLAGTAVGAVAALAVSPL